MLHGHEWDSMNMVAGMQLGVNAAAWLLWREFCYVNAAKCVLRSERGSFSAAGAV